MDNTIHCIQNISGLEGVSFSDNYPTNTSPEHQADLVLALLTGHLPGSVFRAVAKKLCINENQMSTICDHAFNKILAN